MSRLRRLNRGTVISLSGLLVGILGLLVQWVADPARFARGEQPFGIVIPPGILFILGAGLLVLATSRWWWHPVFAVLIAFWIVVLGALANQLTPNLVSSNVGTVGGTVIMSVGLIAAGVAGVASMVMTLRGRPAKSAAAAR